MDTVFWWIVLGWVVLCLAMLLIACLRDPALRRFDDYDDSSSKPTPWYRRERPRAH
jgi:hypothetical protein